MRYNSADAIADVSAETYDAIRARFRELGRVIDLVSAERKALHDEMSRREADAKALLRLGALSESAKAVYRRVLERA